MFSEEAANTNFIVFGLTLSGVEPTVYHTQGERANHYNTYFIVFGLTLSGVEPTVYHTQDDRANHYSTNLVQK